MYISYNDKCNNAICKIFLGVESSGYITLKQPPPLRPPRDPSYPTPVWPENDPRIVRRRVWDAAAALIASIPQVWI